MYGWICCKCGASCAPSQFTCPACNKVNFAPYVPYAPYIPYVPYSPTIEPYFQPNNQPILPFDPICLTQITIC